MIKFTHPHVLKLHEFLLLNIKYDILKNVLIKHLTVEKNIYCASQWVLQNIFCDQKKKETYRFGPHDGK